MREIFVKGLRKSWKSYITVICCGIFMIATIFVCSALSDSLVYIIGKRESNEFEQVANFVTFSTTYQLLFFMMILVLIVHIRNRAYDYKLLELMGIQKKHRRRFIGCEYCGIVLCSTAGGILVGAGVSKLLVIGLRSLFSDITSDIRYGPAPMRMSLLMSAQIFVLLFVILEEMVSLLGIESVTSIGRKSGKPVKKRPVVLLLGLAFMAAAFISLWFYWGRVSSRYPVILATAGLLMTMIGAGGYYLYGLRKKEKKYFKRITWLGNWYHRFFYNMNMSVIVASFVMLILYSYAVILLDSFPLQREEDYPYDLVWMANEEDEVFISGLIEKYGAEVKEQPCMRVATGDLAEHMAIPSSSYEAWTGKKLELDDDEVYVVYQRDRADLNSLGMDYGAKNPRIFIGKARFDLWIYVQGIARPGNKFDKRYKLAGEEDRVLTGRFRDAVQENVVVFSDDYYNKVRADAEGANLCVMMNIPKHYDDVTEEVYKYAKEHSQLNYFSMDNSNLIYEKKTLSLVKRENNLLIASTAILNMLILLICGIFVLLIKFSCDYPDMEWRYRFYCQGGMPPGRRRRCMIQEMAFSAAVPVASALAASVFFLIAEITTKNMDTGWIVKYAVELMIIALIITAVLGVAAALAIRRNIAKMERGSQR